MFMAQRDKEKKFDIGLLCVPTRESVVALRAALSLLRGQSVPRQQIVEPQLITRENVEKFVKPDLPDGVFVDTDLTADELKKLFG
jgi:ribose transport system substrate-binding protein